MTRNENSGQYLILYAINLQDNLFIASVKIGTHIPHNKHAIWRDLINCWCTSTLKISLLQIEFSIWEDNSYYKKNKDLGSSQVIACWEAFLTTQHLTQNDILNTHITFQYEDKWQFWENNVCCADLSTIDSTKKPTSYNTCKMQRHHKYIYFRWEQKF